MFAVVTAPATAIVVRALFEINSVQTKRRAAEIDFLRAEIARARAEADRLSAILEGKNVAIAHLQADVARQEAVEALANAEVRMAKKFLGMKE